MKYFLILVCVFFSAGNASANSHETSEFNPFAPDAEQMLKRFDEAYEKQTGEPAFLDSADARLGTFQSCYQSSCKVFAHVVKDEQKLYLSVDGQVIGTWAVSTGKDGFETPDFDTHPNGRIYTRYSSHAYPGGDYNGLGNMPYAVFIRGGFAIHGTPESNWDALGEPASHGCIRLHPDNAEVFNHLVRENGVANTWISVE